jgi:AraC-like DNA-binding protein
MLASKSLQYNRGWTRVISVLEPSSFAPFGRPVEVFGLSDGDAVEVGTEPSEKLTVCETGKIRLDVLEGLPILMVALPDSAYLTAFLLDRPVELKAGVRFTVLAFTGTCRYRSNVTVSASSAEIPRLMPIPGMTLVPGLEIRSIFTLFYQDRDPGFRFRGEQHPLWELTYVDKGVLVSSTDGLERPMPQGALVLYAPEVQQTQRGDGEHPVGFITATFDARLDGFVSWSGQAFETDEAQRKAVASMLQEGTSQEPYSEDLAIGYLKEVLVRLLRKVRDRGTKSEARPDGRPTTSRRTNLENMIAQRCAAYIDLHFAEPIDLATIARSIPVSRSYLTALFRRARGVTVHGYKREKRLEQARLNIIQGGMTLAEVARSVGFRSAAHFSNEFHSRYGISPSEYARTVEGTFAVRRNRPPPQM